MIKNKSIKYSILFIVILLITTLFFFGCKSPTQEEGPTAQSVKARAFELARGDVEDNFAQVEFLTEDDNEFIEKIGQTDNKVNTKVSIYFSIGGLEEEYLWEYFLEYNKEADSLSILEIIKHEDEFVAEEIPEEHPEENPEKSLEEQETEEEMAEEPSEENFEEPPEEEPGEPEPEEPPQDQGQQPQDSNGQQTQDPEELKRRAYGAAQYYVEQKNANKEYSNKYTIFYYPDYQQGLVDWRSESEIIVRLFFKTDFTQSPNRFLVFLNDIYLKYDKGKDKFEVYKDKDLEYIKKAIGAAYAYIKQQNPSGASFGYELDHITNVSISPFWELNEFDIDGMGTFVSAISFSTQNKPNAWIIKARYDIFTDSFNFYNVDKNWDINKSPSW